MVLAMMRRPPERPFLHGAASEAGDEELHYTAGLIRAMGKITMIAGGYAEHADEVANDAQKDGGDIDAGEQHRQASQVQTDERHALHPIGERRGARLRELLAREGGGADDGSDGRANETLLVGWSDRSSDEL